MPEEYELDHDDFRLINLAFNALQRTAGLPADLHRIKADALQNRFAKAHTGWLELEELP